MSGYRISQLAERTGFSPSTLRYYEQVGLLAAERTPGGYRRYGEAEVQRLRFISRAKQLGLPLAGIRELVAIWEAGACVSVKARLRELITARASDTAARMSELTAFRADLARARDGFAAPSPAGRCEEDCGCFASRDHPMNIGRPWPAGPARMEQRPDDAAGTPVTCSLSTDGQAGRTAEWASLLALATGRTDTDGGTDITFPPEPDLAGRVATLAAREKECCAFFAFTLDIGTTITLHVRAPREAAPLVTQLLAQPES